jgi:hypothetical protein
MATGQSSDVFLTPPEEEDSVDMGTVFLNGQIMNMKIKNL